MILVILYNHFLKQIEPFWYIDSGIFFFILGDSFFNFCGFHLFCLLPPQHRNNHVSFPFIFTSTLVFLSAWLLMTSYFCVTFHNPVLNSVCGFVTLLSFFFAVFNIFVFSCDVSFLLISFFCSTSFYFSSYPIFELLFHKVQILFNFLECAKQLQTFYTIFEVQIS